DDKLSALESYGCADWINEFRSQAPLAIAEKQRDEFVSRLARSPKSPPIEWPSNWKMQELCDVAPRPELTLHTEGGHGNTNVEAGLCFHYGEQSVDWSRPGAVLLAPEKRCQVVRQIAAEEALVQRLPELGFQRVAYQSRWKIPGKQVPFVVAALLQEGWQVRGNKQLFRRPGAFKIDVASGIDWFDMGGGLEFDGLTATLPELLAALRRGERFVRLGDGSLGMLPEEWLKRHGALLQLGEAQDGKVRFQNTQLGLLDALLAELPEVNVDESLAAARQKLSAFIGIAPREAGGAFTGSLRGYQKAGLGWLHFLRDFRWGGCLADDMGLGKTVQVLALLLDAHAAKKPGKRAADAPPSSLAVMPRSIVFNWMREAASFAPGLRVLDYSGGDRKLKAGELDQADLVLMTYGTLRRDIAELRKREFNYVILDEAQAIKNPESQNAKSARLLRGRCRLAMTGTPVENSLNDLWSIFEFLNPGMLGGARAFRAAFSNGDPSGDGASHRVLQRLLRPFILRRRKEQVATDLPPRTEQTIECTMSAAQAKHYAQLRDHYRAALLGRIDRDGLNKSKVFVLEALLRLRQAACHPGLIDERFAEMETAKLDALLPMLAETTAEGHKTLVFSQFTEFLSIVRTRLDAQGLTYEYLDGQTRDRQARVDRFQNDAACPLFLISLKAGGVGLNLTAADYVVILDPWWNPAVEAQAIDRTHRIGQTRSVIAYRLIARDTVEAHILELQQRKRDLADAIITQANSLLTDLTRDDLNLLLS
ncbi:MAG: helicase SNF2, partial [Planctomycetes bacterium]|nr:helicase SNF2 [Planctomycetota bacterium]